MKLYMIECSCNLKFLIEAENANDAEEEGVEEFIKRINYLPAEVDSYVSAEYDMDDEDEEEGGDNE